VAGVLAAAGCAQSTNTTTSSTTTYMSLALSVSPKPIVATTATVDGYQWSAPFTATVTESGGVGGTVYSVQAALNQASNGIEVVTDKELVLTQVNATTSSLPARGSVAIPIVIQYTLPGGGKEAVVDVTVTVAGADGYFYQAAQRYSVSP
jgi:hypothetical protein